MFIIIALKNKVLFNFKGTYALKPNIMEETFNVELFFYKRYPKIKRKKIFEFDHHKY